MWGAINVDEKPHGQSPVASTLGNAEERVDQCLEETLEFERQGRKQHRWTNTPMLSIFFPNSSVKQGHMKRRTVNIGISSSTSRQSALRVA